MKYPKINKQPRREVNVPELSGGLNLRDSLTGVRDNQLTECLNMWYKDGMLRTRPGFECNGSTIAAALGNGGYERMNAKVHSEITYNDAVLVSFQIEFYDYKTIFFWWQNENEGFDVSLVYCYEKGDYFVVDKDGVLYCYTADCAIWKLDYKNGATKWKEVSKGDFYVPTVMAHCQRTGWSDFGGVQFESYNLICNRYKMVYSAYNEADSDTSHPMRYALMQELPTSGEITIDITTYNSADDDVITVQHKIVYDKSKYDAFSQGNILIESFAENEEPKDGLYMFVKYNYVGFLFESEFTYTSGIANIVSEEEKSRYAYSEDNIVITAPYIANENDYKKVFCMTQYTWFGGGANGIDGGSRLFLCGNTDESEQALVLWSSLNNPLYFPENNCAYVGNKAQPVTAFGKQGENLIIFKPNETYYTYYVFNDEITADDLINQTVVDYEANSVYFPIVALHATIGCDCPGTVQLCRNRLVWTNSDGAVYTLVSANQYSEMTVYPVSEMVEQKLKQYTKQELIGATACDFEGYYMLIIGNEAWLMDYNSYGYTHVYSYSKTEDANCLIPWYYWTLVPEHYFEEEEKPCYNKINNAIIAVYFPRPKDSWFTFYFSVLKRDNAIGQDKIVYYVTEAERQIKDISVKSKMQTKLFDFSEAHYLKNIDRVSVAFGDNGGEPINVSFVTDKGSESDVVTLSGSSTDERDAAFTQSKTVYPCIRAVCKFGVKLECDGPLLVDGLSLQYRLLGENK